MIDVAGTGPQANGGSANTYVSQFGGMNGQWVHSNVASTTGSQNRYNLSANGCDRRIRVQARFEIQAADGSLEASTSPASRGCSDFWIVNAVPQWGDRHQLSNRVVSDTSPTSEGPRFLTNYPSWSNSSSNNNTMFKAVRLAQSGAGDINGFGIAVDISSTANFSSFDTVYLVDAASNGRGRGTTTTYEEDQYRQFVQNVSPKYINEHNNGNQSKKGEWSYISNPIDNANPYYRCSVYSAWSAGGVKSRLSAFQYFKIDTETKGNWSDVCGKIEWEV